MPTGRQAVFLGERELCQPGICFPPQESYFCSLSTHKRTVMKKVLAIVVIAAIASSCSTYTCPTYSKKEVKQAVAEKKI